MWRKFLRKNKTYIILIVLLLLFIVILYSSYRKNDLSIGKNTIISEIIYPWQKLTSILAKSVNSLFQSFINVFNLKEDNEKLQKKLYMLESERNHLYEVMKENERLKNLLDYKKKVNYKLKLANIIARDVNNYYNAVTIDLGEQDDIKKDMPVITNKGVVGKVAIVSSETSQVLLITDYNSRTNGIVQRSRCAGSINGKSKGICEMQYLSINDDVKTGDVVITSNDSRIFPKGLIIGEVTNVSNAADGMSLSVSVKPAADMLKLEEVFVLIKE